jgi:hypothetical protein
MIALTLRVNVVGYDYTGYGASMEHGIPPTEKQTYKDIERVYDWCIESKLVKVLVVYFVNLILTQSVTLDSGVFHCIPIYNRTQRKS